MKLGNILKYFWGEKISSLWKSSDARRVVGVVAFVAIMLAIFYSSFSPQHVTLRKDEVAKRNVVSNITAVIIDEQQTEQLKAQAAAKVQKAYQEDQSALTNARSDIKGFYANLRQIIASDNADKKTALKNLLDGVAHRKNLFKNVDTLAMANYLLIAKPVDIDKMEQATISVVEAAMEQPITEEALPREYDAINSQVDKIAFNPTAQAIVKLIAADSIRANLIFNQEATNRAIKEAQDAVEPVHKTVLAGEIIVREGERVTAEQISILEQLGIQRTQSYVMIMSGFALFILICLWLVAQFLKRYYRDLFKNDKQMLLLGLIVVLNILIARFLVAIQVTSQPGINAMTGYLAPIAAGSMLIAILLDNRLAYFINTIMALLLGLITEGSQLAFMIVAFVGGTAGVYRVSRLSQTSDLAKAGFHIALANVITILTMVLISGNITISVILAGIALGLVSGLLCSILMIGALPYLENGFAITSMIRLLELSNPNQELLKRLLLEAPGTYHHSLMVGNLAEASAESIGANPLLVRVGAYYHDIGKIKRSDYFVENQRSFDEPHNKIAPALSALIIISHVKEGLELAREAHLPQVIVDFIVGHHGTSLAKYFYSRAIEEEGEGMVNEDSFRYEGPKPQTKEVALVMLADAVEAAVRSLPNPNLDSIRSMVRKIIRDKLNDGQLDDCDLTFKDLNVVANSFCNVLGGVYHKRIEYPDLIEELTKRRGRYGDDDHQPAEPGQI